MTCVFFFFSFFVLRYFFTLQSYIFGACFRDPGLGYGDVLIAAAAVAGRGSLSARHLPRTSTGGMMFCCAGFHDGTREAEKASRGSLVG